MKLVLLIGSCIVAIGSAVVAVVLFKEKKTVKDPYLIFCIFTFVVNILMVCRMLGLAKLF